MGAPDLHKKYGVTKLCKRLHEADDNPAWEVIDGGKAFTLVQNLEEQGYPNVRYERGLPRGKDNTPDFSYRARGVKGDPGVLWQTYVSDPLVKSSVDATHEGLASGQWTFVVPEKTPAGIRKSVERHAKFCQHTLIDSRPSHWSDFLKGWTFGDRVYGFSLWEIVDATDGGINALKYRRPGTVGKWLFTEDGRDWAGTSFEYDGSNFPDVTISSEHLLLYSTGIGLDLEGLSALRPVVRWVEIKQLITQIETAAAESHGNGTGVVRDPEGKADTDDLKKVIAELEAAAASDDPIVYIGRFLYERISPNGNLPDFEALRRYCDEQISLALKSTGSLVGLGDTGTYNLAEIKDNVENIRRIRYFGEQVCALINEHIVPRIIRNAFGAPINPRFMPKLTFSLGSDTKDPDWLENLTKATQAGFIDPNDTEVQNKVREYLDLAPVDESKTPPTNPDGDEEDATDDQESQFSHEPPRPGESHAERAIRVGDFVLLERPTELNYDPEKLRKWVLESNNEIGRALRKTAAEYRDRYVELTRNVSDPQRLMRMSRAVRDQYLDRYADTIKFELNRLALKGSAAQLRQLGALEVEQGQLPLPRVSKSAGNPDKVYGLKRLSDQFHRHIDMQAQRIAQHAINVTQSYLDSNAVVELPEDAPEKLKPQIPTASAFAKHAQRYTQRTFNYGREQIVQRIRNEAEARGIGDTRIVMEFSSVMEEDSCEPCRQNDGRRYFLNSKPYQRDKPPYRNHEGPSDTCLCLMNAILPAEQGYRDILAELDAGGSKVTGFADPYLRHVITLTQDTAHD
ncbi:hypothetical protein FIV42_00725 [Persicimonas caeni]|uniref:Uncharacterized protein n=1 Tax=Persicimonas caeni TaxID=2292766 RepID=A0A4Y6PLZ1_PERCE|nr:hypothetical protein [Persicimonas caeni]QDG49308.1 hypothetical protein FIV42_00725 [Persicimonas caeni]QED30529.1 hypothetical protein FRD00_00720 [Persicimonas caeni]